MKTLEEIIKEFPEYTGWEEPRELWFQRFAEHILAAAFREVLPEPIDEKDTMDCGENWMRDKILINLRLFSPEVAKRLEEK